MSTRCRGVWVAAALLCASSSVLAARTLPVRGLVLPEPGEIRLLGNDAFYHLRHARRAVASFPHLQRWDVGTHYPHGQRSRYAGFFDLGAAASALLLGAPVELVLAWAPPVLGALAIVALYALGRAFLCTAGALLACLLLILYPGTWRDRTLLGFADHHALEVLLGLLAAVAMVRLLRTEQTDPRPAWRPALIAALPLSIFFFTWPGAPLWVLAVAAALIVHVGVEVVCHGDPGPGSSAASRLSLGLLAAVGLPAVLRPSWVLVPEVVAPLLAGLTGLALASRLLPVAVAAGRRSGVSDAWLGAALLATVAGAAWILVEHTAAGASLAARLVARKSTVVAEHLDVDWGTYARLLGLPGALAIAACPLALARAPRGSEERRAVAPLALTAVLLLLWWASGDYGYALPPLVALGAAYVLCCADRPLVGGHIARSVFRVGVALALVLPVWPLAWVRSPLPRDADALLHVDDAWRTALAWMREHTPRPSLPVGAHVSPWGAEGFAYPEGTYGVMVPWDYGNAVSALARRHPVWSQGPSLQTALWLLDTGAESRTRESLCAGCRGSEEVRYVVLGAKTLADGFLARVRLARLPLGLYVASSDGAEAEPTFGPRYERSIAARLYLADGNGLSHYRLVFETAQQSELVYEARGGPRGLSVRRVAVPVGDDDARPAQSEPGVRRYGRETRASVKIFEVVEGARLVGAAAPGAPVTAELELRSETGRRSWIHRVRRVAGDDGAFHLVLPYSTRGAGGSPVRARGAWHVASDAGGLELEIAEDEVREGARIVLDLGSGTATRADHQEGRTDRER